MLLLFSHSVVSNSLWLHELQHTSLPCPSLSPRVCSNSCPLSQWCHPTIAPFSSCPQSFPASGYFQWVSSLHWVAEVLELQLHHQSFQWIFRVDFLYKWLVWSPCCPRDSQESSPAHNSKASILWCSAFFFMVQCSYLYMTTGKTIVLTIRTLEPWIPKLLLLGGTLFPSFLKRWKRDLTGRWCSCTQTAQCHPESKPWSHSTKGPDLRLLLIV